MHAKVTEPESKEDAVEAPGPQTDINRMIGTPSSCRYSYGQRLKLNSEDFWLGSTWKQCRATQSCARAMMMLMREVYFLVLGCELGCMMHE